MPPPDRGPASGRGLLDARALWASMVGPHRLAMGVKKSFLLGTTGATKIGDNIAKADAYVLIGVQAIDFTTPFVLLFSRDESMGSGAGYPHVYWDSSDFKQLLLPGEQLFAQFYLSLGGVDTETRVVVSQVTF